jgi:hypothetical protein
MRRVIIDMAIGAMFALVGALAMGQELVPTPDPVGGAKSAAGQPAQASSTTDQWRYRWFDGRWWYWTPQNRWMWYSDDGRWVEFDKDQAPPAVGYYAPGPGYWAGRSPGVAVGVGPWGSVGVGVGRRVGVDVWGPHGNVRVGRINVGW